MLHQVFPALYFLQLVIPKEEWYFAVILFNWSFFSPFLCLWSLNFCHFTSSVSSSKLISFTFIVSAPSVAFPNSSTKVWIFLTPQGPLLKNTWHMLLGMSALRTVLSAVLLPPYCSLFRWCLWSPFEIDTMTSGKNFVKFKYVCCCFFKSYDLSLKQQS